jgi:hypothetical protein
MFVRLVVSIVRLIVSIVRTLFLMGLLLVWEWSVV